MFEIIPALDISQEKLCRMALGGPAEVREFGGEPLAAAEWFAAAGARWVHIVDVDMAFTGRPFNIGVTTAVHARFPALAVQASGGLVTREDLSRSLEAGASRAVLGSAALSDRDLVEGLAAEFGERLVIGIETEEGRIVPRGKERSATLDLASTLSWIGALPVTRLLHTNVRRVGQRLGPDLEGLRTVLGTRLPTLAAGGIASVRDAREVRSAGAEGAVVGRAALEGTFDLPQALRELRGPDPSPH